MIRINKDTATPLTSNTSKSNSTNLRQRCISHFQNTILWRCYLLSSILQEASNQLPFDSDLAHLAFRIGLLGLETPRLPAISKALEVKLINQEHELVSLLKRLSIGPNELELLRDRANKLKNINPMHAQKQGTGNSNNYWYYSLPLMLASYLFDVLYNIGQDDQELAFDSALAALGMKANMSESQHPLLCEGIRRQRGELALTLLLTFKGKCFIDYFKY